MKKLTYEYVKSYFKDQGCELLEDEYKNNSTKMKYICSCGNVSKINFGNFKSGKRCMRCKDNQKHTLKYVEKYFKNRKCELLENNYENNYTKMRYRCQCGEKSKIRFSSFKAGHRCKKCSGTEKHTLEYIQQYFKNRGCELVDDKYISSKTKMKYKCSCGDISKISFDGFKRGKRCKKCGINKVANKSRHTLEYIQQYFKNEGCELLEKKYVNSNTKMKYKCLCGDIGKIRFGSFRMGKRCKKCGIKKRSGENSSLWNPNLTNKHRLDKRMYFAYYRWRNYIYKKDNFICQKCLQKGKYLNDHHIINYSSSEKLRLDKSNGITFCKDCHKEFHKKYGIKNNNRQQLEEFLKQNVLQATS